MTSSESNPTPSKSPAFQFYAMDFVTGCTSLSTEEIGAYILLMCECWDKGSIPGGDMALLARITKLPVSRMRKAWTVLRLKFQDVDAYHFIQPRIEKVRQAQIEFRRRQSDKGKASAAAKASAKGQPETNRASTEPQPDGQPKVNSPVSGFLSPERKKDPSLSIDPKIDEIAGAFLEQYPAIFAKCRAGGVYRVSRLKMERDLEYARELATSWPSLPRLLSMLEVFLLAKIGDKNSPGSPGQFLHMAPEMDALLKQNGL